MGEKKRRRWVAPVVLARDWDNLDLKVAEYDLQRRGPGLILDIKSADGALLLLWTE